MNTKSRIVFATMAAAATFSFAMLFGAWISACNSPTLPLPPPAQAEISATLDPLNSEAEIVGRKEAVEPHALVTCFNNRTGVGTVGLATEDGRFTIRVAAEQGDVIEIWQRVGGDPPSVAIEVR